MQSFDIMRNKLKASYRELKDANSAEDLIKKADEALYTAKRTAEIRR